MEATHERDRVVPITIDKKGYKTPTHTTGKALNALGTVPTGFDLFLDVRGPGSDHLIPNDDTKIEVREGSHFYTVKQILNPGHE